MIAVVVLWLAATPPLELMNQVFDIPAHQWRYAELKDNPPGAVLSCDFQASGSPVRVGLIGQGELEVWKAGRGHPGLAATPLRLRGNLRIGVQEPDLNLVIDNSAPQAARVHVRVLRQEPPIGYLSRNRKLAVILISFGVFFAIVTLSARRLLKSIRK